MSSNLFYGTNPRLRLAWLNNHNTATEFIAKTCSNYGAEVYIPLLCPEKGAAAFDVAKNLRTINNLHELDSLNVYRDDSPGLSARQILELNSFDYVIIPGAVRTKPLFEVASLCSAKILIYEWGDVGNVKLHRDWDRFLIRPNVRLAVTNKTLSDHAIYLPLGLPEEKLKRVIDGRSSDLAAGACLSLQTRPNLYNDRYALLIASRLYKNCYADSYIRQMLDVLRSNRLGLVIAGKDISAQYAQMLYLHNHEHWNWVQIYSDLPDLQFYSILGKSSCLLYWMNEKYVCQYSALEANYLGVPVVYFEDTMISAYMHPSDSLRLTVTDRAREVDDLLMSSRLQPLIQNFYIDQSDWTRLFNRELDLEFSQ